MAFQSNADYFKFFANESRRGGSPLYERLSHGIANDVEVQNLAAKRKNGQPPEEAPQTGWSQAPSQPPPAN